MSDALPMLKSAIGKSRLLSTRTGAPSGSRFMAASKAIAKDADALVDKQAIVGVDGMKGILLKAYKAVGGATLKPFDTETRAKEYLAKKRGLARPSGQIRG
jgi:hypothetical protein